jgi:NAD(P)-dependent dehydrogenase (short-subunit alcohol dehydrogenase family)
MAGQSEVVVVAGVGPGLGLALAERFAAGGGRVAMLARDGGKLERLAEGRAGLVPYVCDVTDPAAVDGVFARVQSELGVPSCVVFNASTFARGPIAELVPEQFEQAWRIGCMGGFLVGRAAARAMLHAGRGTILFTGATASLRGSALFAPFAASKFGLRALAQSMARELGPRGIHVAHVIIDGQISSPRFQALEAERGPDSLLKPADIAEAYWQLHRQPRSTWTFELELRPWVERF